MPHRPRSAGDALPQRCAVIEIRVAELRQLFNAIDQSPFRQRDLDPRAEEFIVDWAKDLPGDVTPIGGVPVRLVADSCRPLLKRLSTMPVKIEYKETADTDAWRADWPEVTNLERVMASENTGHQHTPEEERRIREAALDETIADSFPASDPPSSDPNPDDHAAFERVRPAVDEAKRRRP